MKEDLAIGFIHGCGSQSPLLWWVFSSRSTRAAAVPGVPSVPLLSSLFPEIFHAAATSQSWRLVGHFASSFLWMWWLWLANKQAPLWEKCELVNGRNVLTFNSTALIICSRPKMSFVTKGLWFCCSLYCCKGSLIMSLFGLIYIACAQASLFCLLKQERPGESGSSGAVSVSGETAHGAACAPHRCPASNVIPSILAGICKVRMCLVCCQSCLGLFWPTRHFLLLMNLSYSLSLVNKKWMGKWHSRKGGEKISL